MLFSEANKEFEDRDPRGRGLGDKACWDAERFQRALTFELGDHFHVDGGVLLFTVLGTALTYRVFDFDLGFGLFFASVSGFWSLVLLILINSMRDRGRRVELHGAIQRRILGILILTLPANYVFIALNYSDVQWADEITWWKPAVEIAWFVAFMTHLAQTYSLQAFLLCWHYIHTFAFLHSRHPLPLCCLSSEERYL